MNTPGPLRTLQPIFFPTEIHQTQPLNLREVFLMNTEASGKHSNQLRACTDAYLKQYRHIALQGISQKNLDIVR